MPNEESKQTYETLSQNHNEKLNSIIKEINELCDKNSNNDKIEGEIIVNNKLNDGLKGYLENHKDEAILLINKINSIETKNLSDSVIKSLQNLVNLISGIVNQPTEQNETQKDDLPVHNLTEITNLSFYKFKKIIKEKKDFNLSEFEVINILNFIDNDENNVKTLNLYLEIVSTQETNRTNTELFNRIVNAIRNHFNISRGADIKTVKKLRLDEVFKNMNTKNDLTELHKKYIGDNRNGSKLSEKGKFKDDTHPIISYNDFFIRFNERYNKINFNKTIDKDKVGKNMTKERVNSINKYVNSIMEGNGNEFLKFDGNDLKYNIEKVRKFLSSINDKNFNKIIRYGKYAWISAIQIFFNEILGKKLTIDGEYKKGGETYLSVLNFQKEYNKNHKNKLKEDGIPGPKTLSRLLGVNGNDSGGVLESIDTSKFDQYELAILKVNSEKFYEGYNYTEEEIEAHHHYKRGRIIENIESYIQNIINEKRNIGKREIIESIRSDLVTLPTKEKADIIQGIHKVVEKFNNIRKYLDFRNGPYRSPKELLCAMRGIKDNKIISHITNNITVKQHGVGLTFFVGDQESYYTIYGCGTPQGQGSGGFNHQRSAIKELEGTLSVVNGKDPGNNMLNYNYRTIQHEGQHNRNTYFMPDKNDKPITRAKDEITAYLREGRNIKKIEETLTKDKSKGGLYQYGLRGTEREAHKRKVRELLKYANDLIELTKRNIGLTKDKIISMLSDTPTELRKNMHDKVMNAANNGSNLHEIWRTGTGEKQTEINEINLAKSINEIKHILSNPKYSHIPRGPDNKGGIEISAMIDEVVAGKLNINHIPSEIRQQVQKFINQ